MEACLVHLFLHPTDLNFPDDVGGFPNVDMTKLKGYRSKPSGDESTHS